MENIGKLYTILKGEPVTLDDNTRTRTQLVIKDSRMIKKYSKSDMNKAFVFCTKNIKPDIPLDEVARLLNALYNSHVFSHVKKSKLFKIVSDRHLEGDKIAEFVKFLLERDPENVPGVNVPRIYNVLTHLPYIFDRQGVKLLNEHLTLESKQDFLDSLLRSESKNFFKPYLPDKQHLIFLNDFKCKEEEEECSHHLYGLFLDEKLNFDKFNFRNDLLYVMSCELYNPALVRKIVHTALRKCVSFTEIASEIRISQNAMNIYPMYDIIGYEYKYKGQNIKFIDALDTDVKTNILNEIVTFKTTNGHNIDPETLGRLDALVEIIDSNLKEPKNIKNIKELVHILFAIRPVKIDETTTIFPIEKDGENTYNKEHIDKLFKHCKTLLKNIKGDGVQSLLYAYYNCKFFSSEQKSQLLESIFEKIVNTEKSELIRLLSSEKDSNDQSLIYNIVTSKTNLLNEQNIKLLKKHLTQENKQDLLDSLLRSSSADSSRSYLDFLDHSKYVHKLFLDENLNFDEFNFNNDLAYVMSNKDYNPSLVESIVHTALEKGVSFDDIIHRILQSENIHLTDKIKQIYSITNYECEGKNVKIIDKIDFDKKFNIDVTILDKIRLLIVECNKALNNEKISQEEEESLKNQKVLLTTLVETIEKHTKKPEKETPNGEGTHIGAQDTGSAHDKGGQNSSSAHSKGGQDSSFAHSKDSNANGQSTPPLNKASDEQKDSIFTKAKNSIYSVLKSIYNTAYNVVENILNAIKYACNTIIAFLPFGENETEVSVNNTELKEPTSEPIIDRGTGAATAA